ncbi:BAG family molecular chaperone regulator 4 [Empidonax traillii]|uniref:BAG family molecular chaperone regulator 4 n=1 Tax=Empidonax traillii TaxID=164674 RepID=UPI000FFCFF64|nr:BAG family molecular chaperone regulator 4 [Empidonax traillii]XP_027757028.1 BAG family molecular chaperone regulator 4 [Empidonax traillii]XP_027757029.1 BAG family molecular chaperone regulator 4 [Empidonax traillii]XP_027757030.1 BAG family molecular chaperone regulator 4 [Empidonax traillii]
MDSPYANGAYSPPYPQYPSLPQARGFYCSGPPRTPYPPEPTGLYRPPSPAPAWSYVSPECPPEGSALRRQQVPGYSPPQTPGMPMPQYPYGDSSAGVAAQGPVPQPRAPEDTWGPPSVYGVQPRYSWPAAPGHGNLFVPDSHPSWTNSGAPAHPPAWDSQDSAYDRPEQSPSQHGYCSEVKQQQSGPVGEHRPAQPQHRVQYSAQPQLYDLGQRRPPSREPGGKPAEQPPANPAALQPEIQRILHVMGEAEQLEEEVDEFVGKKTDKSYRLLEEMLTKLLLELDSIETGGQDSVRQARKESVHRIQAILEKLERKGL